MHSPIEDARMTSGSTKLVKLPSIWSLIVVFLFRFNVHFKSPTDKSPTHYNAHRSLRKILLKVTIVLFSTLRTHPAEKDFVKFVKSKRKSMEMIASVQTALCPLLDITRCMFSPCIVLLRSGGLAGTWSRTKHFQLDRRERESPRVSCACNRAFDWAAEYSRTPRLSLVPLFLLALVSFSLILSHAVFDASILSTASLPTLSLSLQKAFSCISLKYFALCRSCLLDIPSSLLLRFSLFRFLTSFFLFPFILYYCKYCNCIVIQINNVLIDDFNYLSYYHVSDERS